MRKHKELIHLSRSNHQAKKGTFHLPLQGGACPVCGYIFGLGHGIKFKGSPGCFIELIEHIKSSSLKGHHITRRQYRWKMNAYEIRRLRFQQDHHHYLRPNLVQLPVTLAGPLPLPVFPGTG